MPPSKSPAAYDEDVAPYRQPMVTSIGIIMGFLLAFLANWAVADDDKSALRSPSDWVVAATLMASVVLMAIALFRLLDNRKREAAGARYQATFRLYMAAIVLAFSGLGLALLL